MGLSAQKSSANVGYPPNSARPGGRSGRVRLPPDVGCGPEVRRIAVCARLKFDLFQDAERVINLDPEITHGALQLRVAKQQLHCS